MPRYYFHVREGAEIARDEEGQEFPNVEAARKDALASHREMMGDKLLHGGSLDHRQIEIADETGHIVDVVPARETVLKGGEFRTYGDDVTQSAPKPKPANLPSR